MKTEDSVFWQEKEQEINALFNKMLQNNEGQAEEGIDDWMERLAEKIAAYERSL